MKDHACRIDESLPFKPVNVGLLTISDTRDVESDTSGALLADLIARDGHRVAERVRVHAERGRTRVVGILRRGGDEARGQLRPVVRAASEPARRRARARAVQ